LLMYLEANDIKIEEVMKELEKRKKWVTTIIISLQKFYMER
jgi:phosphoribosyl-ATP pyrophosphohydrolase